MRRAKWICVSLVVLLFVVMTSGFAALTWNARSTVVSQQPLIDGMGEIYGMSSVIGTSQEPDSMPDPILTAGNQVFTKTQLDIGSSSNGSGPDALGVIIELKDAPVLEIRGNALRAKMPTQQMEALVTAQEAKLKQSHGRLKDEGTRVFGKGRMRHLEYSASINAIALLDVGVNEAIRKLGKHPDVKRITPNGKVRTQLLDSIPQMKVNPVWSFVGANSTALDGTGMKIGIIDTGVDYRHMDLGGCLGSTCKVSGGYDFVNGDSDPMDDHGHGTHVAATAAGNGALVGAAPGAKIYAYKVLGADGSGFNTAIISAIERCYTEHLDVCSLSLGGSGNPDDPMSIAIDNATLNGVLFTVAAGNSGPSDGTISSPGTSRKAITVAAACKTADIGVDPTCQTPIAQFSSHGPVTWSDSTGVTRTLAKPDIAAPGHRICAAQWGSAWSDRECLDGNHVSISGTSMATPHVAGVAALIRQAHPEFTPDQVKTILLSSANSLGQPVNAQGTGHIDAFNALNLSGIPSSVAQISGVPLSIIDNPTVLNASYTRNLTIKNTSGQSLTYVPSFSTNQPGFTASFDRSTLTLAAGSSSPLSITFRIDHSAVMSPQQLTGTVTLITPSGVAKAGVSIYVQDRLIANQSTIDLGVDTPTQSIWNSSQTLTLTNVLSDASTSYSVTLTMPNPSITATADRSTLTLAPNASAPLVINVTANNSALANTRYSGTLKLSSATQNLTIPVTFFKGYGIRFNYGSEPVPTYLQYHQGNSIASLIKPGSTTPSTMLYVTGAGPWSAHGLWMGEAPPLNSAHVVRTDLLLTQSITDVSMRRSDATHTLSFNPVTPSGSSSLPNSTFKWGVLHRASGNKMDIAGGTFSGGQVKVSDIPSSYTFLAAAGGVDSSGSLLSYVYRIANGITTDLNLSNTASSLVKKNLAGFHNQDSSSGTAISPNLCLPTYVSTASVNLAGSCFNASWVKTTLSPNQLGSVYTYNYGAEDLSTSQTSDYPFFQLYSASPSDTSGFPFIYRSPLFYVTPVKTLVFANAASGTKPFFTQPSTALRDYLVETPPGNTLSVGSGPIFDSSRWYNYADGDVSLSSQKGMNLPLHLWGDSSDEWITIWNSVNQAKLATTYVIAKDGANISSGTVTVTNGAKLAIAPPLSGSLTQPGNYRFELTRNALINGKPTQTKTVSTFRIVSLATHQNTPVDENPPAVTSMHLLSNGIWQNVMNPTGANTLSFQLNPVPGYLTATTLMADSLSGVTAEMSTDGGTNWSALPLTAASGNNYSTVVPIIANASLYTFRIKATDSAANTLTHTLQIPTGTVLSVPVADTQLPVTAITSPTNGQTTSGTVNVSATASDNIGVTKVELFRNGVNIGTRTASPYTFSWNTSLSPNGSYTLQTKAYDAAGNIGTSAPVSVTVVNSVSDTTPPAVSITTPVNGGTVARRTTVAIAATATDNVGVTRVDIYANGTLLCGDTVAPYSCAWKTPNKAGTQQIKAYAFDLAGNQGTSTVTVTSK